MFKEERCNRHSKLPLFEWFCCWALAPVGKMYWALHKSHDVGTGLRSRGEWAYLTVKASCLEDCHTTQFPHMSQGRELLLGYRCRRLWRQSGPPLPLQIGKFFALKEWVTGKLTKQPWQILLWKRITWPILCHDPFTQKGSSCINSWEASGNAKRSGSPGKGKDMTEIVTSRATSTETAFHIQVSYYLKAIGYGPKQA